MRQLISKCTVALLEGLLINILILVVALVVLDKATDLTIDNAVKVADVTGSGKTTTGFILVAFCTSLPALSVSIFSALTDKMSVAIGNALGSNIVNICLILGVCLLLVALRKLGGVKLLTSMAKEEIGSLYFGLFVGSAIPLALIYIGYAGWVIGVILLAIFGIYTYRLIKVKAIVEEELDLDVGQRQNLSKHTSLALLSAAAVVAISYFVVDSASYIATGVGLPPVIIGGTVVAFGTSMPVLMASIRAIRRKQVDMALGNIVGTCYVNTTLILGASLVVSPLRVDMGAFSSLVMFSVIANLFLWYFLANEKIGWREGVVLLFMYFLFLTISLGGYKP
jgi:cation:H+ antiporter